MKDLITASVRTIIKSIQLLSTEKIEYALDHLLYLISGAESVECCINIAKSGDKVFAAFVKSTVHKQRLNLSWILVSCARISESSKMLLEKVVTIDNLAFLLNQEDVQILLNCGELIGKVFQYSSQVPVEISRAAISLLVARIKAPRKTEEMDRCLLGVLLQVLCRAEVSRIFIEEHFSVLLDLASSSCKPMVPIILSQLFSQSEEKDDQVVQDASLK
jgi:hypothetical protein